MNQEVLNELAAIVRAKIKTGDISVDHEGQPIVMLNDPCPCGSGKTYHECHDKLIFADEDMPP